MLLKAKYLLWCSMPDNCYHGVAEGEGTGCRALVQPRSRHQAEGEGFVGVPAYRCLSLLLRVCTVNTLCTSLAFTLHCILLSLAIMGGTLMNNAAQPVGLHVLQREWIEQQQAQATQTATWPDHVYENFFVLVSSFDAVRWHSTGISSTVTLMQYFRMVTNSCELSVGI